MNQLENLPISRCIQPVDFGEKKSVTFHHFSDAPENKYDQCSYIRLVDNDNRAHCSLLFGKSSSNLLFHRYLFQSQGWS